MVDQVKRAPAVVLRGVVEIPDDVEDDIRFLSRTWHIQRIRVSMWSRWPAFCSTSRPCRSCAGRRPP